MALYSKPNNLNVIWASGGDRVAPDPSKIATGWLAEIPPRQYFNYIDWKQDQWVAYSNQIGIPEWDNETEYQANKSVVQGSNGVIYQCLVTGTNIDPVSDTSSRWKRIAVEDAPANGLQYVRRNNNWQQLDGSVFAPVVHTHTMSQVTGLENALNNKLNVTGNVPALNSSSSIRLELTSTSSSTNFVRGVVGGSNSWQIGKTSTSSNNLVLQNILGGTSVTLSDSNVSINKPVLIQGYTPWHSGNFNPSNKLDVSSSFARDGSSWKVSSASNGTTYTNNLSRPIMINAWTSGDSSVVYIEGYCQGVLVAVDQGYNGRTAFISFVVPPWASYRIVSNVSLGGVRELS